MGMTDPVADMLTRIRNGCQAKNDKVSIPLSRLKIEVVKVLKEEGYVKNFKVSRDKARGVLTVFLKYDDKNTSVIMGIKRVSKPGKRVYATKDRLPKVMSGLGVSILSTSKGIMTGEEAGKAGIGGEVLCEVW